MKSLIFDTGPVISLVTNNLLWIIEKLKERFSGEFYITKAVKKELVDRPLHIRRFEFEALQVSRLIEEGIFKVIDVDKMLKNKIINLANNIFFAFNKPIRIIHEGEAEVLAAAINIDANAIVIDERNTRLLVEDPEKLREIFEKKLHTKVDTNKENLKDFNKLKKNIKIIRSTELVMVAYEHGFLEKYLIKNISKAREKLVEALLWGLRVRGCSISTKDIQEAIKLET